MQTPPRRPGRPRLLTWVLLLLLALVGWGLIDQPPGPAPDQQFVQARRAPPEVVPATGDLAHVYEAARPATVRVEARCAAMPEDHGAIGTGTGFFVSESGLLLTAYHVVRSQQAMNCAFQYSAFTVDEERLPLSLIGFDAVLDIALMQAGTDEPVPWLPLASSLPPVGSEVVAIGNSRGDFLADRAGKVLRRNVSANQVTFASGTLEMDAALAPGDSGGPVLNSAGEVVGVVSYVSFNATAGQSDEGLIPRLIRGALDRPDFTSYAVPVLAGSDLQRELWSGGQRDIPVIGFSLQFNYVPEASDLPLGRLPGVVVGPVQPGGPAADAGIRSFRQAPVLDSEGRPVGTSVNADVIVAINGRPTPTFDDLLSQIYRYRVGEAVNVSIQRGNDVVDVELLLGARREVFRQ